MSVTGYVRNFKLNIVHKFQGIRALFIKNNGIEADL
jgi:hypothetical protein